MRDNLSSLPEFSFDLPALALTYLRLYAFEMVKLPRFRDFFMHYPKLDGVRISFITNFFHFWFEVGDKSFKIHRLATKSAEPYILGNRQKEPVIYAAYHGHMPGFLGLEPRQDVNILVSQSRDGEIVARTLQKVGFSVVRGSPAHGRMHAAYGLVSALKEGKKIVFTVDGPRGPIYSVKPNIIKLAELAGVPIIPYVCSVDAHWLIRLKTWDNWLSPAVGCTYLYMFGDPIYVPAIASEQELKASCERLSKSMEELRLQADAFWQN